VSNATRLLLLLATAAIGGCASEPDPRNPYGTWELTYTPAPCGPERVDQLRVLTSLPGAENVRLWWPTTDNADRVDTEFLFNGGFDGVLEVLADPMGPDGQIYLTITLTDPPVSELRLSEGGCSSGDVSALAVKLEDA
jgi:hypothetical protein